MSAPRKQRQEPAGDLPARRDRAHEGLQAHQGCELSAHRKAGCGLSVSRAVRPLPGGQFLRRGTARGEARLDRYSSGNRADQLSPSASSKATSNNTHNTGCCEQRMRKHLPKNQAFSHEHPQQTGVLPLLASSASAQNNKHQGLLLAPPPFAPGGKTFSTSLTALLRPGLTTTDTRPCRRTDGACTPVLRNHARSVPHRARCVPSSSSVSTSHKHGYSPAHCGAAVNPPNIVRHFHGSFHSVHFGQVTDD